MREEQYSDEIDLIAVLKSLWISRKWIFKVTLVFMSIGLVIAFITPKQYKAEAAFVPQTGEQKIGSSISGLAALAGVNINSENTSQIPASLYPSVTKSTAYQLELLNSTVQMASGTELLFKDYLLYHQKTSLSGTLLQYTLAPLLQLLKSSPQKPNPTDKRDFYTITDEEHQLMETLNELLSVNYNEKEGVVDLSIQLSHPEVAAQMAATAMENLQQTIIAFKIKNAEKVLEYVSTQYRRKEKEFLQIQKELAEFNDSHKNIGTAVFENERDKLETRYNLSFNLYKELALQKEQAQLQVNKDTPIFSVIQPVTQPHKKESPKRALILMLWTFLGLVTGCGYVLTAPIIRNMKNEILKKN